MHTHHTSIKRDMKISPPTLIPPMCQNQSITHITRGLHWFTTTKVHLKIQPYIGGFLRGWCRVRTTTIHDIRATPARCMPTTTHTTTLGQVSPSRSVKCLGLDKTIRLMKSKNIDSVGDVSRLYIKLAKVIFMVK
mmetsp:Transcript_14055/g.22255  ORF Transcript_14055/g.22255 Transcript_14055/m.22255 type:complete len:135 (+) Transcript_14055:2529-2933(+)